MQRRIIYLFLKACLLSFYPLPLWSQKVHCGTEVISLLENYNTAKELYTQGHYGQAQDYFAQLTQAGSQETVLSPYIHFYYGLSAYYNKDVTLARHIFLDILNRFTYWNQRNEAYFWSAACCFELNAWEDGFKLLSQVNGKHMLERISQLKTYFLPQIGELDRLEKLAGQFPKDPLICSALFKKAASYAYMEQDQTLIHSLEERYQCTIAPYDPLSSLLSRKKPTYAVAVMLPFFVDNLSLKSKSSFVLELYEGIKLAVEQLEKEGIKIQLFAFDTQKDQTTTQKLLNQDAMQYMDLIIGPLYPEPIALVKHFCKKHQINFLNPISTNGAIVHGNPFGFLFQTSLESSAEKAAYLTLKDIAERRLQDPMIGIFYGVSSVDQMQVNRYKALVEGALGKPIALSISFANRSSIKQFIAEQNSINEPASKPVEPSMESTHEVGTQPDEPTTELHHEPDQEAEGTDKVKVDFKQLTHIYLPFHLHNDPKGCYELLISSLVNLGAKSPTKPTMIGYGSWIKQNWLNLNQMKRLPILFLFPGYIDFDKPILNKLKVEFLHATGLLPTEYHYVGYDAMLFFGKMLSNYGTFFQKGWEDQHYTNVIFDGVQYGKHHDNQHIPIVRFYQDRFQLIKQTG